MTKQHDSATPQGRDRPVGIEITEEMIEAATAIYDNFYVRGGPEENSTLEMILEAYRAMRLAAPYQQNQ